MTGRCVYPSCAAAVRLPGIGQVGAQWLAAQDLGLVLWDFHDARGNPRGRLRSTANCLLGPAVSTLKDAGSSTGRFVAPPPAIHRSTGVLVNPLLLY
ncbi:hypothetical protein ACIQU5_17330 [Streptomyces sp. NPDC090306]|uniref:hypothetical protein n=1 Tax=Streptomyces sp. NPDC090306 TaxID=3365961 RepID=UPI00382D693E